MTRTTNARLAGFMFLFYIATAFPAMMLSDRASAGDTTAAKLAAIARHPSEMRVSTVLSLVTVFDALALAVALYALTRDVDPDLAMLALSCRIAEGVLNAVATIATAALVWVAGGGGGPSAAAALGAVLLAMQEWFFCVGATVFAVGSTLFAYLFLRGRSIPISLAWLGLIGSALLVVELPARLAGWISGPMTMWMWIPVAIFEIVLGFWLLIKGA